MKKILFFMIVLNIVVFCKDTTSISQKIIESFINLNLGVGDYIIYTEKSDPNEKLGRPNQYVEKINFEDLSVSKESRSIDNGTIEVFSNEEDMIARKKYIEEVIKMYPFLNLNYYMYCYKNVLFRLESKVLPSKAKKYEKAFYEILSSQ